MATQQAGRVLSNITAAIWSVQCTSFDKLLTVSDQVTSGCPPTHPTHLKLLAPNPAILSSSGTNQSLKVLCAAERPCKTRDPGCEGLMCRRSTSSSNLTHLRILQMSRLLRLMDRATKFKIYSFGACGQGKGASPREHDKDWVQEIMMCAPMEPRCMARADDSCMTVAVESCNSTTATSCNSKQLQLQEIARK